MGKKGPPYDPIHDKLDCWARKFFGENNVDEKYAKQIRREKRAAKIKYDGSGPYVGRSGHPSPPHSTAGPDPVNLWSPGSGSGGRPMPAHTQSLGNPDPFPPPHLQHQHSSPAGSQNLHSPGFQHSGRQGSLFGPPRSPDSRFRNPAFGSHSPPGSQHIPPPGFPPGSHPRPGPSNGSVPDPADPESSHRSGNQNSLPDVRPDPHQGFAEPSEVQSGRDPTHLSPIGDMNRTYLHGVIFEGEGGSRKSR